MPMTAGQGFNLAANLPEPLPLPSELTGSGFKIRHGQLTMVAGQSGAGKSLFTMWLLHRVGLSTLYFSADMDPFDATVRLGAMATGMTQEEIEEEMRGEALDYYRNILNAIPFQFCYDSSPSLDDLVAELDAYVEVNDAFPDVVVMDNLVNLEGSEEYQGQMYLLSELHSLARLTGAAIFVLHHAKETDKKEVWMPASKKGVSNMVTQYPELVLTVGLDQVNERFFIACVKQRGGKADASGNTYTTLTADPARCSYGTPRPAAVANYWSEVE